MVATARHADEIKRVIGASTDSDVAAHSELATAQRELSRLREEADQASTSAANATDEAVARVRREHEDEKKSIQRELKVVQVRLLSLLFLLCLRHPLSHIITLGRRMSLTPK